jgi:hypothetical protein
MKLDDRLYSETDDTCAICGLRGISVLTIHHIDGNSRNSVYDIGNAPIPLFQARIEFLRTTPA